MLNFRSVADLNRTIAQCLPVIRAQPFDAVIGIPRSGMIPASLIATHLQMPLGDVAGALRGDVFARYHTKTRPHRILLVDDSVNKGRAMAAAVAQLAKLRCEITRFAVYAPYQVENPASVVDLALEECRGPRVFQWNLWKHIRLERWGFDFDGVFCRDPNALENDDGERYRHFMSVIPPLFMPTRPIGHIITGRIEKYRPDTVAQLRRYGTSFSSLTMLPYATKAERMAAGGRGQWKAQEIKRLGLEFYIESNPKQAAIIARDAGIPVWCVSTQELHR